MKINSKYFKKIRVVSVLLLCTLFIVSSLLFTARAGVLYLNPNTYKEFQSAKSKVAESHAYYERVMGDLYDKENIKLTNNTKVLAESKAVQYDPVYNHLFGNLNVTSCGLLISRYDTLTSASPTDYNKGISLHLTVSDELQRFISNLYSDTRTSVVVLRRGEILAAVSSYREEVNLGHLLSDHEVENAGKKYGEPVFIAGYQGDCYPPGSVYKIFTAALMAEHGKDNLVYNDTGTYTINESGITEVVHNDGGAVNGMIDLKTAFEFSSNVYFVYAFNQFSMRDIRTLSKKFLLNGEVIESDIGSWSANTTFIDYNLSEKSSTGFGQGHLEVPTISLAMMTQGALWRQIYRPHAVSSLCYRDEYGDLVDFEPTEEEIISNDVISERSAEIIRDLMANNAESYGIRSGSSNRCFAKTGTAELPDGKQRATLITATENETVVVISSITDENMYGKDHVRNMNKILAKIDELDESDESEE